MEQETGDRGLDRGGTGDRRQGTGDRGGTGDRRQWNLKLVSFYLIKSNRNNLFGATFLVNCPLTLHVVVLLNTYFFVRVDVADVAELVEVLDLRDEAEENRELEKRDAMAVYSLCKNIK